MQDIFLLVIYAGLAGALLLLGVEMIPELRPWRKPALAFWLTLLTLLWLAVPDGRLVLSQWSPAQVLGGQLVLDISRSIWWLGAVVGLTFSGVAWIETADSRRLFSLSGTLAVLALLTIWLALASASLLTTLLAWSAFDLIWGIGSMLSGGDGERVTYALSLHGIASLILWGSYLLLVRSGGGTVWWLLWPTPAVLVLLVIAALVRVGLYPLHIVFPQRGRFPSSLSQVVNAGPLLGIAVLYRILELPGEIVIPMWVAVAASSSLFWGGFRAWAEVKGRALQWAQFAILSGIVVGGATMYGPAGAWLLQAASLWFAASALLHTSRARDTDAVAWSWPGWLALVMLLGAPPSPVRGLFAVLAPSLGGVWRTVFAVGWGLALASLAHWLGRPVQHHAVSPPLGWQQAALAGGLAILVIALLGSVLIAPYTSPIAQGVVVWGGMLLLVLVVCMARRGPWPLVARLRKYDIRRSLAGSLELIDMQWLHRAIWRGIEHLLGVVRVLAEVVEGSSALLWSLLILLLVFLVVSNR